MAKSQDSGHSGDETIMNEGRNPIIISSENIFGKGSFVYIEHDGQRYVLRITRENKLILTK